MKRSLWTHGIIGTALYVLFATLDILITLKGTAGDPTLEGNPAMQYMMVHFGHDSGLILGKTLVYCCSVIVALVAVIGIENRAGWVYFLAFTRWTRNWMKAKRRYWVAFIPLYLVAFSQGIAFSCWLWVMAN